MASSSPGRFLRSAKGGAAAKRSSAMRNSSRALARGLPWRRAITRESCDTTPACGLSGASAAAAR